MLYYNDKVLWLLKSCLRKIRSNCVKTRFIRFKTQYDVNKIEFYCNTKDKTAVLNNSFVVYDFSCLGCGASETETTLYDCTGVQHLFDIASLHSSLFTSSAPIQNSDKFD